MVNARSALLSNFEVLTLLRELESDHLAQTKIALRIKKEDEEAGRPANNYASAEQVSENLRTVEIEVSRDFCLRAQTDLHISSGNTVPDR